MHGWYKACGSILCKDGKILPNVPLSQMFRHINDLLSIIGQDRDGHASGYDATVVLQKLVDVLALPKLRQAMKEHRYGEVLINRLCYENWQSVLERTWGY